MVAHKIQPVGDDATVIYLDESYRRDAFVQLVGEVSATVAKGRSNVILNMKALPGITSEGIGLLVLVNDKCREGGGKLVLCEVSQRVEHVIKLAGLTRFFETVKTEEDSIKLMQKEEPAPAPAPAEEKPAAAAASPAEVKIEEPGKELTEEEKLRLVIANTVKSRAHQRLIESFESRSFKTASLDDIAETIGSDREQALVAAKHLVERNVMTTDDNEIFTFAPSGAAKDELETFRKAWGTPRFRTRIMAWLYSEEKKPR